jgi:hypothetical protein
VEVSGHIRAPAVLPPGKKPPVPIVPLCPRAVLDVVSKNSQPPPGIEPRSSDSPARSQSLYQLSYRCLWLVANPYRTIDNTCQQRFSINVWCITYDHLTRPYISEGRLTEEICFSVLQNEFPIRLDEFPLMTRPRMHLQHDGAPPHFSQQVTNCLNDMYPFAWPSRSPDLNLHGVI